MRRLLIAALVSSAAFSSPVTAVAQDVIGSAVVNGKKIQILEDFTWQFEDRLAESCFLVTAGLDFCGKPAGWGRISNKPPQIAGAFEQGGRNYAFFVSEPVGRAEGITLDALAKGVVGNLANGMGVTPADVPIFDTKDGEFYGQRVRTIAMQAKLQGVVFVFINTFWVEENRSGQVFTYTFGDNLRESDGLLHSQVTGSLSFSD